MRQVETNVFRRVGENSLIGALAVGSVTLVCYRLHASLATVGFLYLSVIVLLSSIGSFFPSALISILAVGCLDYFFAPPIFSLRVIDPLNVVAITTFLVTSFVITRLVSRIRLMTDEALSSVHRKLIDAEEREYTQIARELSEDINQRVALVAFGLEQLEEQGHQAAEIRRQTRELWQRVSEIGTDLHLISHRLRSSNLEYLGVETTAKSFCKEFAQQQKVEIDFKSHDVPSHPPLEISFTIFRVLQEALINSAKHSGKRHIEVEMFGTSDAIHLTVCDSGSGFDPVVAVQGRGLGLTSMRERLKLVNGEFSIDSQAQRGTKIHASVPLSPGGDARIAAWRRGSN
jgi:signal transduction histidine kinase